MADHDFGGHMRCRLADGTNLTMRGSFSLSIGRYSIEDGTNSDHTNYRNAKPKARSAEVSFEDTGVDFDALLMAPRQDIYITEEFTGISHVFLNAFFSGEDSSDRATGEVTGLTIKGSGYQRLNG